MTLETGVASEEATFASGLPRAAELRLPASLPAHLFVVVDTEEEFDWSAPYARTNTAVTAMQHIGRVQAVFDRYRIRPTYVIDYPVATQPEGFAPLQEIWRDGRCTVGAHVHPWVNPPHEEALGRRNSFIGNLPVPAQRAKLETLCEAIAAQFERPRIFKAGRYGLGRATVGLLDELGFEVDTSVTPRMDFRDEDGPSFVAFDWRPFFLTTRLLEIPCTIDYTGWSGVLKPVLHRIASSRILTRARAVGVLSRTGIVNRVMLSPEGNSVDEMRDLTRALFHRGCRTFTFSFHSPSVAAGHTPYVQTAAQLTEFLDAIDRYCEFFMGELEGVATTPHEFRASVAPYLESAE